MRAPWALVLVCALAVGCGPSLRRIHLSEAYFERCYAGDRDVRATDLERRACWQAWLASWAEGQPAERRGYAEERVLVLDPAHRAILAVALAGDADLDDAAATATGAGAPTVAPAAAGPDRPPRPAATPGDAASGTAADVPRPGPAGADPERADELRRRHRPIAPRTSSPACAAACEPDWVRCVDRCAEGDRPCVGACRVAHRTCARGCY